MTRFLKAGNPYHAWVKAVKTVMNHGKRVLDERKSTTLEVEDLVIEIADPLQSKPSHHFWYGDKLSRYREQLLSGDRQGFVYTYGNRFREYFSIDQINEVILRLSRNQNTRRAVMVTWDPVMDNENNEIPCIITVQFRIRDYKLNTSVFWRSNDIYGAYYANVAGLTAIIKLVAGEVGVDVGTLTTHAGSAHIYSANFEEANEIRRRR